MSQPQKKRSTVSGKLGSGEFVKFRTGGTKGRVAGDFWVRVGNLLDQKVRSDADVVKLVVGGLPARSMTRLSSKVVGAGALVAPDTTIRRRLKDETRFSTSESERMVRLARVYSLAVEVFGDEDRANSWLQRRLEYVPGEGAQSPLEVSVTDPGARLVEDLLLRTQHGIY